MLRLEDSPTSEPDSAISLGLASSTSGLTSMDSPLRRLPEHLRKSFQKLNDQPIWFDRLWLAFVVVGVFLFGVETGRVVEAERSVREKQRILAVASEALSIGERCSEQLSSITRVAIMFSRGTRWGD